MDQKNIVYYEATLIPDAFYDKEKNREKQGTQSFLQESKHEK